MRAALKAGAVYFAIVFLCGFALGTIRVLIVSPRVGETAAVMIELPIILAISWITCASCVTRFRVQPGIRSRLPMGTTAFALLQAAELGVATGIFGMTPAQYLARFSTGYGAIGLLAQALFALFPLLTNRRDHARPD